MRRANVKGDALLRACGVMLPLGDVLDGGVPEPEPALLPVPSESREGPLTDEETTLGGPGFVNKDDDDSEEAEAEEDEENEGVDVAGREGTDEPGRGGNAGGACSAVAAAGAFDGVFAARNTALCGLGGCCGGVVAANAPDCVLGRAGSAIILLLERNATKSRLLTYRNNIRSSYQNHLCLGRDQKSVGTKMCCSGRELD